MTTTLDLRMLQQDGIAALELCRAAYAGNPEELLYLSSVGVFSSSCDVGDIFGFTGFDQQRERIVVVFRGAKVVDVWIEEMKLKFSENYTYFGCVNEGFLLAFESVRDQVKFQLALLRRNHPSAPVLVTGHGLGGALATLLVAEVSHSLPPPPSITIPPPDPATLVPPTPPLPPSSSSSHVGHGTTGDAVSTTTGVVDLWDRTPRVPQPAPSGGSSPPDLWARKRTHMSQPPDTSIPPSLPNDGYIPDLMTFGSPRVGDQAFAVHLHQLYVEAACLPSDHPAPTFYRFSHHRDPVVHLPFSLPWMPRRYMHCGREVYEPGDGVVDEDTGEVELRLCSTLNGEDPLGANSQDGVPCLAYHSVYLNYEVS